MAHIHFVFVRAKNHRKKDVDGHDADMTVHIENLKSREREGERENGQIYI